MPDLFYSQQKEDLLKVVNCMKHNDNRISKSEIREIIVNDNTFIRVVDLLARFKDFISITDYDQSNDSDYVLIGNYDEFISRINLYFSDKRYDVAKDIFDCVINN